ncbi:type II toxin-antitoxin system VapC family toxin [Candidatus Woesearchaeota archaeon]|nr:type II toxin-antitoxin system VapC family toxin [Candidatus Woesearchaeota archaeon]
MEEMDKICLDTDFLVDFLRENEQAVQFIEEVKGQSILATTYVNLFELYYGAFKSLKPELHLPAVELLKAKLIILNLSGSSVKFAGEVRLSQSF